MMVTPSQTPLIIEHLWANSFISLLLDLIYHLLHKPLSQFSHSPRTSHMQALTRVLRYIKFNPGQGLFFPTLNNLQLTAFCDSDWASCNESRKSVSGYAMFLGSSLISWQSKKQSVVSRSSTEAEYMALADSTCEITWLHCLLKDLSVPIATPVLVILVCILFS